jgi:hypothetical protein
MDAINLNSNKVYQQMNQAAEQWSLAAEKEIILDEHRKATFSKCFAKHKLTCKSVAEAEHKARTDEEYTKVVKEFAVATKELIKAKLNYNNLDRLASLRQTEVKRDLTLAGKQEG